MLRNYLAAALRNLLRNRLYAALNIAGLALGFTVAILIALFVWHERSFERFLPGYEGIYRLSGSSGARNPSGAGTSDVRGPIIDLLKLDFPQISSIASLRISFGGRGLRRGDVEAVEPGFYWADPEIFDVLPLRAAAGDLRTALERPDGLVLTRRMARKYFGTDLPIGETIEVDRERTMRVTAVLEDLPSNTHLNAEVFASVRALPPLPEGFVFRHYVYLRLAPGASADALRAAFPDFIDRHQLQSSASGKASDNLRYALVPIGDIHLRPSGRFAMKPGGDPRLLRAITIIGVLVLFTAAINFINLMTARAARRAVEVGVRKAAGGTRGDLTLQFIGESLLYALLGLLFAIALTELLLPWLNAFLDRAIVFDYWHPPVLAALLGLVLVTGTLAGTYPALVLSAFRPAAVLKGTGSLVAGSGRLRQLLVLLQFAILIGLTLATGVIQQQTAFGLHEGLRFDRDQLLRIRMPDVGCEESAFTIAVRALPGVQGTACSSEFLNNYGTQQYRTRDGRVLTLLNTFVGPGLFELLGLTPVAGRFFSQERDGDSIPDDPRERAIGMPYRTVVNETTVRQLGLPNAAAAIGETFTSVSDVRPGTLREIIGVVPDFTRDSVREPIAPIFFDRVAGFNQLNVKLRGANVPETLRAIDGLWRQISPAPTPISRQFFDQYVEDLYRDLERQSVLFSLLAGIALLLAGLGLYGLAAFTVERRTREIGVRKALGAQTSDVTRLLLWDFARPVLWANLLVWPVAAWLMSRWLQGFAYHIDLPLWLFPAVGVLALAIALLTVAGHSLHVAAAPPVKALRQE